METQMEMIRRNMLAPVTLEKREMGEGDEKETKEFIRGYFAVYDSDYPMWDGYTERIAPTAFNQTDMSDVVCLFNHDDDMLLGRLTNGKGTLSIGYDERGGYFEVEKNETTASKDVYENIRLGNVQGCSFAFTISSEEIERNEDGSTIVTITGVKKLYDVGPVVNPAYKETEVEAAKRSMEKRAPKPEPFNFDKSLLKVQLNIK
jgi:HK97 family phage prohead protease